MLHRPYLTLSYTIVALAVVALAGFASSLEVVIIPCGTTDYSNFISGTSYIVQDCADLGAFVFNGPLVNVTVHVANSTMRRGSSSITFLGALTNISVTADACVFPLSTYAPQDAMAAFGSGASIAQVSLRILNSRIVSPLTANHAGNLVLVRAETFSGSLIELANTTVSITTNAFTGVRAFAVQPTAFYAGNFIVLTDSTVSMTANQGEARLFDLNGQTYLQSGCQQTAFAVERSQITLRSGQFASWLVYARQHTLYNSTISIQNSVVDGTGVTDCGIFALTTASPLNEGSALRIWNASVSVNSGSGSSYIVLFDSDTRVFSSEVVVRNLTATLVSQAGNAAAITLRAQANFVTSMLVMSNTTLSLKSVSGGSRLFDGASSSIQSSVLKFDGLHTALEGANDVALLRLSSSTLITIGSTVTIIQSSFTMNATGGDAFAIVVSGRSGFDTSSSVHVTGTSLSISASDTAAEAAIFSVAGFSLVRQSTVTFRDVVAVVSAPLGQATGINFDNANLHRNSEVEMLRSTVFLTGETARCVSSTVTVVSDASGISFVDTTFSVSSVTTSPVVDKCASCFALFDRQSSLSSSAFVVVDSTTVTISASMGTAFGFYFVDDSYLDDSSLTVVRSTFEISALGAVSSILTPNIGPAGGFRFAPSTIGLQNRAAIVVQQSSFAVAAAASGSAVGPCFTIHFEGYPITSGSSVQLDAVYASVTCAVATSIAITADSWVTDSAQINITSSHFDAVSLQESKFENVYCANGGVLDHSVVSIRDTYFNSGTGNSGSAGLRCGTLAMYPSCGVADGSRVVMDNVTGDVSCLANAYGVSLSADNTAQFSLTNSRFHVTSTGNDANAAGIFLESIVGGPKMTSRFTVAQSEFYLTGSFNVYGVLFQTANLTEGSVFAVTDTVIRLNASADVALLSVATSDSSIAAGSIMSFNNLTTTIIALPATQPVDVLRVADLAFASNATISLTNSFITMNVSAAPVGMTSRTVNILRAMPPADRPLVDVLFNFRSVSVVCIGEQPCGAWALLQGVTQTTRLAVKFTTFENVGAAAADVADVICDFECSTVNNDRLALNLSSSLCSPTTYKESTRCWSPTASPTATTRQTRTVSLSSSVTKSVSRRASRSATMVLSRTLTISNTPLTPSVGTPSSTASHGEFTVSAQATKSHNAASSTRSATCPLTLTLTNASLISATAAATASRSAVLTRSMTPLTTDTKTHINVTTAPSATHASFTASHSASTDATATASRAAVIPPRRNRTRTRSRPWTPNGTTNDTQAPLPSPGNVSNASAASVDSMLLVSHAAVATTTAAFHSVAALVGMFSAPGLGLDAARALSLLDVANCEVNRWSEAHGGPSRPLPFPSSAWPSFTLRSDTAGAVTEADHRRGAIIAGIAMLLVVILCGAVAVTVVAVAMKCRQRGTPFQRCWKRATMRLRCPGVLLVGLSLFADGVFAAATFVTARRPSDAFFGILGVAVLAVGAAASIVASRLLRKRGKYQLRKAASGSGGTAKNATSMALPQPRRFAQVDREGESSTNSVAAPCWRLPPGWLRGEYRWASATTPKGAAWFLSSCGPIVTPYRDGRAWFYAVDISLTFCMAVARGIRGAPGVPCTLAAWLTAGVAAAVLAVVVLLQPYSAPSRNWLFTLSSMITSSAAVLVAVGVTLQQREELRDQTAVRLLDAGMILALVSAAVVVVAAVAGIIGWFVGLRSRRRKRKALKEQYRQHRDAEEHAVVHATLPMDNADRPFRRGSSRAAFVIGGDNSVEMTEAGGHRTSIPMDPTLAAELDFSGVLVHSGRDDDGDYLEDDDQDPFVTAGASGSNDLPIPAMNASVLTRLASMTRTVNDEEEAPPNVVDIEVDIEMDFDAHELDGDLPLAACHEDQISPLAARLPPNDEPPRQVSLPQATLDSDDGNDSHQEARAAEQLRGDPAEDAAQQPELQLTDRQPELDTMQPLASSGGEPPVVVGEEGAVVLQEHSPAVDDKNTDHAAGVHSPNVHFDPTANTDLKE
jgi:energy-converting hydrogenase Eha subunit C